jgi:hypothetical protein
MSEKRESDPRYLLGKQMYYHCTILAFAFTISIISLFKNYSRRKKYVIIIKLLKKVKNHEAINKK